jgi:multiple sugar transport system permease protein
MSATAAETRPGTRRWRASPERMLAYGCAILLTLFMLLPVYLITLAAFSSGSAIFDYPRALVPSSPSLESIGFFVGFQGVIPSFARSLIVGGITVVLSLLLGCPAGYAIARYNFRGRDLIQLLLVNVRAVPVIIISISLVVTFIQTGLYDTILSVALVHTAMTLPFTVLLSASVFLRVPAELEEAAMAMGTSRFGAVIRVVLPNSVPGLSAAALFAFVTSWNEVFVAVILTQNNTTLPAQVVSQLATSPLPFRFAGGFALMVPAFVFIFFMRPYLFSAFRGVGAH